MAESSRGQKSRFAVGVSHRIAKLQHCLQDLIDAGVPRDVLCLAAQQEMMENVRHYNATGASGDLLSHLASDTLAVGKDEEDFLVWVTSGGLADRLAATLAQGDNHDGSWLERWLIPRHAR